MNTKHASVFRPVMTSDEMQGAINAVKAMSEHEQLEAFKPDNEVGREFRRCLVSGFIQTRRNARENIRMLEKVNFNIGRMRRCIEKIKRSKSAFLESHKMLECRKFVRDSLQDRDKLRALAADIGRSVEHDVKFLSHFMPREFVLDLFNVGVEARAAMKEFENPLSIEEIVRYGFADDYRASRGMQPLQWCLIRARSAAATADMTSASAPEEEATPDRFAEKAAELEVLRDEHKSLKFILKEAAHDMDNAQDGDAFHSSAYVRVEAMERTFALWERAMAALLDCDGFSLAQKAALLNADPAKVAEANLPESTTLLEMVSAGLEVSAESIENEDMSHTFLMLGAASSITEVRDDLEVHRGMIAQYAMMKAAHKPGATVFNSVVTLQ